MRFPVPVRRVVAAVVGVAACAAAWVRLAPEEPFLDVTTVRTEDPSVWTVTITARGDESVGEVRVGPAIGPVEVVGESVARGLSRNRSAAFTVRLPAGHTSDRCYVRISRTGEDARTWDYDVPLKEKP